MKRSKGSLIPYDVTNAPHISPDVFGYPIMETKPRRRDNGRWSLYSADELGQFPTVEWLIPGWLAAGELTVLYGEGGSFKSFVAMSWACQLAAQGRTCIYIAAEGASGLRARIGAWEVRHRQPSLLPLLILPENVALQDSAETSEWIRTISDQIDARAVDLPDLVIVDTVARNFVGGDENSAKDMGQFVEGCESIRKRYDSAVLPIHHTKKSNPKSERGTQALRNASFAMFSTASVKRAGSGEVRVKLTCDRMKDAEPPAVVDLIFGEVALPPMDEGDAGPVTSLAMTHHFPPTAGDVLSERVDALEATIEILTRHESLGMDKLLRLVRDAGVRVGTDMGRNLFREWSEDPSVPIERNPGGGYRFRELSE